LKEGEDSGSLIIYAHPLPFIPRLSPYVGGSDDTGVDGSHLVSNGHATIAIAASNGDGADAGNRCRFLA